MKKIIIIAGFVGAFALPSVSAGYFDNAPAPYCDVSITRNLSVGSSGTEVAILQTMLSRGGYLHATPNGNFGPATKQAVRAFQYDNGISQTGSVGEATRNAVNERLCDADVTANSYSDYGYGFGYGSSNGYDGYSYNSYNSNTTYVTDTDPYVRVVSPNPLPPVVYGTPGTPQNNNLPLVNTYNSQTYASPVNFDPVFSPTNLTALPTVLNAPSSAQIASTNIIYSPYVGYTYGLTPVPGTMTVTSPVARTSYQEGDTVFVRWSTNNLNNPSQYQVVLENNSGGQSKVVAVTGQTSASFVLTRDVLDAVCAGDCVNYGRDSYKIVITTPVTDIAGQTSTFKASVSPITIVRGYGFGQGQVSITPSKTPVNSGEGFKLYVNIPTGASWDSGLYGQYSFKIHAICPAAVSVTIAGIPCGSEFALPFTPTSLQQQIPVIVTNSTWYTQSVTFEMVVTNVLGQTIGTSRATVIVNGMPFSF